MKNLRWMSCATFSDVGSHKYFVFYSENNSNDFLKFFFQKLEQCGLSFWESSVGEVFGLHTVIVKN
jgi:hypothetical protein